MKSETYVSGIRSIIRVVALVMNSSTQILPICPFPSRPVIARRETRSPQIIWRDIFVTFCHQQTFPLIFCQDRRNIKGIGFMAVQKGFTNSDFHLLQVGGTLSNI